jgi:hypothetical protein
VVIWYISVTVLLALLGTTAVQLTVFTLSWIVGFDVWIIPNLWADVPVQDIFRPLYTVSRSNPGQAAYRLAVVAAIVGMGYWFSQQGTGFDEFLDQQKKVVEDLYAGNLLSDTAAPRGSGPGTGKPSRYRDASLGYGKRRGQNIPSLEELDAMFNDAGVGSGAPAAGGETPVMDAAAEAAAADETAEAAAAAAMSEGAAEDL